MLLTLVAYETISEKVLIGGNPSGEGSSHIPLITKEVSDRQSMDNFAVDAGTSVSLKYVPKAHSSSLSYLSLPAPVVDQHPLHHLRILETN